MSHRTLGRLLASLTFSGFLQASLLAQTPLPAASPAIMPLPRTTTASPDGLQPVAYFDAAPSRLPDVASNARVTELEQRLADLEARLAGETKTGALTQSATPPAGHVVGSDLAMIPTWNNGLELQSKNKDFRVRIGGRMQWDMSAFDQSEALTNTPLALGGVGPNNDAVNFRRARLRVDGTMWEVVGWAAEYDFSNMANVSNIPGNPPGFPSSVQGPPGQGPLAIVPTPTDVYVTIMKLPVMGNFRIGNFKEPIGFEHLTGSRWLDFMERSYNQDAFYGPFNNGFMPGMMFFNWAENELSTWALWAGPNQSNVFGYHVGDQWAGTTRGTHLLYYDEPSNGRYLMHVGGSASIRDPDQGQARIRARGDIRSGPPSTINPVYADTGSFATSAQYEMNFEWVTIWGPWTLQAEYLGTWFMDAANNPLNPVTPPAQQPGLVGTENVYFQGGYIEALYFLTGESRAYDRRAGCVDRVVPLENFFRVRGGDGCICSGWGAWQVGVRYGALSLNSGQFNGGMLNSVTLGLNWFLTPNLKFQWNYDYTRRGAVDLAPAGDINSFGMRMAFDF